MKNHPPRLLRILFHLLCPSERKAEIEGDLNEVYEKELMEKGRLRANLNYCSNALSMLNFDGYLRFLSFSRHSGHVRSVFRAKLRSIVKFRFSTIFSLLTLSLGAVTSGLLFFYIHYEYSYDEFHEGASNIYRVNSISQNDRGEQTSMAIVPLPAGPKIVEDFDEALAYVRLQKLNPTVRFGINTFEEPNTFLTDNSFFDVFSFPIVSGNSVSPLSAPQTVVLTKSMAVKYFGEQDPIGQIIQLDVKKSYSLNFTQKSFTVTAVVEDPPKNTHIKFDLLASISTLGDFKEDDWLGGLATYIKLLPGHEVDLVNQKFDPLIRENLGPNLQARFRMSFDDYLKSGRNMSYFIQPITAIHTSASMASEFEEGANRNFLQVLFSVAVLIFILTTVNFFNLSFANGLNRLKEIGIRKSMGAFKHQVFSLILLESIALGVLSLLIAGLLIFLLSPFIQLLNLDLPVDFEFSLSFILSVVLTTLLICFSSGFLIALSLSKISVTKGLRGSLLKGQQGMNLQKTLLGLQFFVAFITLMAAAVFQSQNNFLFDSDLGFDKDNVLIVRNMETMSAADHRTLLNEWAKNPLVESVSLSYQMLGKAFEPLEFKSIETENVEESFVWPILSTDDRFIETYGVQTLERDQLKDLMKTDSSFVLINESAMRAMGFLDASRVLNMKLDFYGKVLSIKGVISDFHHQDLYNTIGPLVLMSPNAYPEPPLNPFKYASIRTSDKSRELIEFLAKKWDVVNASSPFSLSYLGDDLRLNYESEQRLSKMIGSANVIAIMIAILGLMSMSQVIFKVKVKEIAMRKVLGAGSIRLYYLFMHQFLWPLMLAFLLAVPLVVYYLNAWLNKFAYRITLGWELLLFSGVGLVLLALSILTINGLKLARQNPVEFIKIDH